MNLPIASNSTVSVGGIALPFVISIYLKFSAEQTMIQAVVEQAVFNSETGVRSGENTELYYVKDILRMDTPNGPVFNIELIKPTDLIQ